MKAMTISIQNSPQGGKKKKKKKTTVTESLAFPLSNEEKNNIEI